MSGQGFRGDSFHVKVVKRLATFVSMTCPVRVLEHMFRGFCRMLEGDVLCFESLRIYRCLCFRRMHNDDPSHG